MHMFYLVVSAFTWLFVFFTLFVFFPIALLTWIFTALFDPKLRLLHRFTTFWGVSFAWINPFLKIKITGKEKILPHTTYVMICNHQSLLDITIIYHISAYFKWVAKRELFKIPVVGWTMSLNRYIPVDRANKASHIRMMKQCEENLLHGKSLMIFPEGTRSPDGKIQPFKEGAFKLAALAKVPVLPILLDGTAASFPKSGFIFKKMHTIRIKILDPIPYSEFANVNTKEMMHTIHDLMVREFESLSAKTVH
jgi:1-acyl-sn-glycerol-3-phosphate acyltransferase